MVKICQTLPSKFGMKPQDDWTGYSQALKQDSDGGQFYLASMHILSRLQPLTMSETHCWRAK
jgi:hypothetical protein